MENIIFQNIDIRSYDEGNQLIIIMMGRTQDGKSVTCRVKNYKPYFYVRLPIDATERELKATQKGMQWMKSKGLDNIEYFKGKDLYEGFNDEKKFSFLKVICSNKSSMYQIKNIIRGMVRKPDKSRYPGYFNRNSDLFQFYNTKISPEIKLIHDINAKISGWFKIRKNRYIKSYNFGSDINIETGLKSLIPLNNKTDIAPFVTLSYDLETYSHDDSFPRPTIKENVITQIGCTFHRYGNKEVYKKIVLCLKETDKCPGIDIRWFQTEKELLEEFLKVIKEYDPDFITGYNIYDFDYPYLRTRFNIYGFDEYDHADASRYNIMPSKYKQVKFNSSNQGDKFMNFYDYWGRNNIDLLIKIREIEKFPQYSLDYVLTQYFTGNIIDFNKKYILTNSKENLNIGDYIKIGSTFIIFPDKIKIIDVKKENDQYKLFYDTSKFNYLNRTSQELEGKTLKWCLVKDDMPYKDIFKAHRSGNSHDRMLVAKYCAQDCATCNIIMEKTEIITNSISMSNVSSVSIMTLVTRGEGIKAYSLSLRECEKNNYYIKDHEEFENMSYPGAFVFKPERQFLFEDPVCVLDFASLYPSSLIELNMSHETLVKKHSGYENIPNHHYRTIQLYDSDNELTNKKVTYVQKTNMEKGIIPSILHNLLKERKATKNLMKKEKPGSFKYKILNGHQLALKITANSIYGQTGSRFSNIRCLEIAWSTTSLGRKRLFESQKITEKVFTKCVYYLKKEDFKNFHQLCLDKLYPENMQEDIHPISKKELFNKYDYLKKVIKNINQEDINYFIPDFIAITNKLIITDELEKIRYSIYFYHKIKDIIENNHVFPKVVYGDTDSIFVNMRFRTYESLKKNILDDKIDLDSLYINKFDEYQQQYSDIKVLTNKEEEILLRKKSIELGIILGEFCNLNLPYPQNLEYEKTFHPLSLYNKKKYTGYKYEFDHHEKSRTYVDMGGVNKRRSYSQMTKIIAAELNSIMMNNVDKEKDMKKYLIKTLDKMFDNHYPIEFFTLTASLAKNYKSPPAHWYLVQKIKKRDPGSEPKPGSRVNYIIIKPSNGELIKNKIKMKDILETPEYIKENNLKVGYIYYLKNKMKKVLIDYFSLVIGEKNANQYVNNIIRIYEKKSLGQNTMSSVRLKKFSVKKLFNDF